MSFSATPIAQNALQYFLEPDVEDTHLRVSDVFVRVNLGPEIFSQFIRKSTHSQWSHASLLYLMNDPREGYDNMFVLEAMDKIGVRVVSWRTEITPYQKFTVGIKRLPLDWYKETAEEAASHSSQLPASSEARRDPEDTHGIGYLRHVRGLALDQINALFDLGTISELTALYIQRLSKQYFGVQSLIFDIASWFVRLFKSWGNADATPRFICSGLVQYSYFAALHRSIIKGMASPDPNDHAVAMSNLDNIQHVIFRDDPDHIIDEYIQQVKSGKLKPEDDIPGNVQDFLRTTTPADFSNSPNLQWRYVIRAGKVWQIHDGADANYTPQNQDEAAVLALLKPS